MVPLGRRCLADPSRAQENAPRADRTSMVQTRWRTPGITPGIAPSARGHLAPRRLRSRLHGEGGFTLIELLVVILIIGILAAIAIPSFLNQKSKANDASTKSQARTAQTAMETYYTD